MGWSDKYKKSIDCSNPKGFSQKAHCQGRKKKMSEEKKDHEYHMARSQLKTIKNAANRLEKKMGKKGEGELKAWVQSKITKAADYIDTAADYVTNEETVNEGGTLHKWFKGSKSKDGKGGWVNVVTGGTCASDEPGEGTPKCVSSAKRASMSKKERLSAARRKKAADPGQQQKTGAAKPTYVSTDKPKKKMKESVEVTEAKDKKGKGSGTKDACYHKVKSRYSVWPSAYASGALVKCRKVGAANWGNKSEGFTPSQIKALESVGAIELNEKGQKCWKGYEKKGTKMMFGKRYNNCVKKEEAEVVEMASEKQINKKLQKKVDSKDLNPAEYIKNTRMMPGSGIEKKFAEEAEVRYCPKCEKNETREECAYGGKYWDENSMPAKGTEEVSEAVRIPAKTGNIVMVNLGWKGKYYSIKMFFPQISKPSRKDVQDQIEKIYPGGKLYTFVVSNYEPGEPMLHAEGAAWTRKEGKAKSGGLNEKGRKSYERENPGSDLKAPSKKVGNPRRASFCARMKGMKKKLTSKKTANDPDSRINKSLRAWNC
jgi:hypothetical protein